MFRALTTRWAWVAVVIGLGACGGHDEAPAATTGSAARSADRPGSASVRTADPLPVRDLLSAVPADAAFAFVTLEPSDVPERLVAQLDAHRLRDAATARATLPDPLARVTYAAWLELASKLATPDPLRTLGLGNRFAIYTVGVQLVVRVELADEAATAAAVARVMKAAGHGDAGPTWIVDGGSRALLVAIAEHQLVVARGPRAAIHATSARLLGAPTTPITEAELRKLAVDRGIDPRGVGWIDLAKLATSLQAPGAIAELDALAPACRAELLGTLSSWGRGVFGLSEPSPNHIRLALTLGIDTQTSDALVAAAKTTPTLPVDLPGQPMLAVSYISPPPVLRDKWLAIARRFAGACDPTTAVLGPPWNELQSAELVLYNLPGSGKVPGGIDGLVGLSSPHLNAIAAEVAKALPFTLPNDGGAFVTVKTDALFGLVPQISIARRGSTLVAVSGAISKSHAGDLAPHDGAPLMRFMVDAARFRTSDAHPGDDQFFVGPGQFADESGISAGFGAMAVSVDARPAELGLTFGAELGRSRAPRATDPRDATRSQCIAILRRAFAATAPALAKLDIVDDVEDLAATYTSSIEADQAIAACAKLTSAQRSCLAAAQVPQLAAASCAPPGADDFADSKVRFPPLFSFFGSNPLEARWHPPVDGHALVAKLAGTWVRDDGFHTETWTIDGSGNVVATTVANDTKQSQTKRFKLDASKAGALDLVASHGIDHRSWYMPSPDVFFEAGADDVTPVAARDRFAVPMNGGLLVREPSGCWSVTREGALTDATCTATKAGIDVTAGGLSAKYAVVPGWVVSLNVFEAKAFARQK